MVGLLDDEIDEQEPKNNFMDNLPMSFFLVGIVAFFIGVLITRWIFSIDKIIDSLEKQNSYSLVQVRLLKKMLLNQVIHQMKFIK